MNNNRFSHNRILTPFHSSGYAQVSQGNTIGSTNAQSYGQRVHIEKNRTSVGGYRESLVGQNYIRSGADSSGSTRQTPPSYPQRGLTAPTRSFAGRSIQPPRTSFREPPTRYNPYG